jgi:sugar lactone lactonase YvrE
MKKSVLLSLALVACGGAEPLPVEPVPSATPSAAEAPAPAPTPAPTPAAPPAPPPPKPTLTLKDVGFSTPESVLYDAENDVYFVSNIQGAPSAKDGNGFISKIKPDGTVEALKWVDGTKKETPLHAPKGMAIVNGVLHVADIDAVRSFDLSTGKAKGVVAIKGATFLNDLVADEAGTLYVSDTGVTIDEKGVTPTGTDAIWSIAKGKATQLAKGTELGKPNGLAWFGGALWVNTFGSGELYTLEAGKPAKTEKPAGQLDGLVMTVGGSTLLSSWEKGTVYLRKPRGEFAPLVEGLKAPADIGFDTKRGLVLVPLFMDNQVLAFALP